MKEQIIQEYWRSGELCSKELTGSKGELIQIVDPGTLNTDSGPDFNKAHLIIDGINWFGNVEIHIKSSQWFEHGHQHDANYHNIILHVVFENDMEFESQFPTLELKSYISKKRISTFQTYKTRQLRIVEFYKKTGLTSPHPEDLVRRRLERKSCEIELLLKEFRGDWQQVFYSMLFRNIGFKVNALPFEWLSRSARIGVLRPHIHNRQKVESILFGQSGLLNDMQKSNEYIQRLCMNYSSMKIKHQLQPIDGHAWKFSRMRPANFPTIRISQLSGIICSSTGIVFKVIDSLNISEMKDELKVSASPFWNEHYTFHRKSPHSVKKLGQTAIENIIINTIIPFKFHFGKKHFIKNYFNDSLLWLSELSPENNKKVRLWKNQGFKPSNSLETQALIELT